MERIVAIPSTLEIASYPRRVAAPRTSSSPCAFRGNRQLNLRLAGVHAAALACAAPTDPERAGSLGERGDPFATLREASLSLRVSRARCDLQTPSATGRPTVFSAGGRDVPREVRRSRPRGLAASGDGRPALAVKTIVVNPRDAPGWRAQSAAMDLAPMTLDLREELLDAFPPVAGRLARPFFASEEEGSALGAEDDEDASRKVTPPRESRPAGSREESRETRGVGPSVAGLSGLSLIHI